MNLHKQALSLILLSLVTFSGCYAMDRADLSLDFSTPEALLNSLTKTSNQNTQLKQELKKKNMQLSTLTNSNRENVLHLAIKAGNLDVMKAIINADPANNWALISGKDMRGNTPLHFIAKREGRENKQDNAIDNQMARLVLTAAGEYAPQLALMTNDDLNTALHWAILRNPSEHADLVRTILNTAGVDREELVFLQDDMKNTALHMAANNRHIPLAIVKDLVEAVPKNRRAELISLPGEKEKTALSNAQGQARYRKKNDVVDYLQGYLSQSDSSSKDSIDASKPIAEPQEKSLLDFSTPEALLQSLANTPSNRVNQELKNGNKQLSTLLNANKETVLHLAIKSGNLDTFKAIIDANNDDAWELISARNNDGETALHYIAKREGRHNKVDNDLDAKMASLLLNKAKDKAPELAMMVTNDLDTALQWAVLRNPSDHIDLVTTILNTTGVDREELVFWQDNMHNTALHMAANSRQIPLAIVKALVEAVPKNKRAELINLPGEKGKTALSNAKDQVRHRASRDDVVRYLQSVLNSK